MIDPRALIERGDKPVVRLRADGRFYLLWFKCLPRDIVVEEWHGPFPDLQMILAWWYGLPPFRPVMLP
jgi:hypothetical protein